MKVSEEKKKCFVDPGIPEDIVNDLAVTFEDYVSSTKELNPSLVDSAFYFFVLGALVIMDPESNFNKNYKSSIEK